MRAIWRGLRNVYRNKTRAGLVVVLLGLSIGVFVTMAQAADRIGDTVTRLEGSVETLLEIRAAGATAMGRGVEPLRSDIAEKVSSVPGVRAVEQYLYVRRVDNSSQYSVSVIAGLEPITGELRVNSHGEVGTPAIVSGRRFNADDKGRNVAVAGTVYARQRGLAVGSTLKLDDISMEIIGIFDSGFVFGDNQVFVPLPIAQELAFEQGFITDKGGVSNIFATARSVGQVSDVEDEIRLRLGDNADVLSGQRNAAIAADSLQRIQSGGVLGALLSLAISALLVLFTMALITRERIREIGVLKALGAPNLTVIRQFVSEAIALSLAGTLVGIALFVAGASFIADRLLGLSSTSLTGLAGGMGSQPASDVVSFTFSASYVGYAFALALALGILGSLYPAYRAARMQPAEALRHE